VVSTVLSLVVVPAFDVTADRARAWVGARLRRRPEVPAAHKIG
jgi:hypothetical protein